MTGEYCDFYIDLCSTKHSQAVENHRMLREWKGDIRVDLISC